MNTNNIMDYEEMIITKSQRIKLTDSIFDGTSYSDGHNDQQNMFWSKVKSRLFNQKSLESKEESKKTDGMKGESFMDGRKFISYDELVKMYFSHEQEEGICEIICTYWPLLGLTMNQIEENFLRNSLTIQYPEDIIPYVRQSREFNLKRVFDALGFVHHDIDEFEICSSRSNNEEALNNFLFRSKNIKEICFILSRLETEEFSKLRMLDFYATSNNSIYEFIGLFNRLTNAFISKILECQGGRKERKVVIKRILKMAAEFERLGVMNCANSCMAALQANCIFKLEGILEDQTKKYQRRHAHLSQLLSVKGNFKRQRQTACLTPWLGIILKDFAFIKEMAAASMLVNLPLSLCLTSLVRQLSLVRESCKQMAMDDSLKMKIILLKKAIIDSRIKYENEESQYLRLEELSNG